MVLDESFDIGPDTRTLVDDSYKLPFRFTGTIDKLTYKIGHEQIGAEDRERMKGRLRPCTTDRPEWRAAIVRAGAPYRHDFNDANSP